MDSIKIINESKSQIYSDHLNLEEYPKKALNLDITKPYSLSTKDIAEQMTLDKTLFFPQENKNIFDTEKDIILFNSLVDSIEYPTFLSTFNLILPTTNKLTFHKNLNDMTFQLQGTKNLIEDIKSKNKDFNLKDPTSLTSASLVYQKILFDNLEGTEVTSHNISPNPNDNKGMNNELFEILDSNIDKKTNNILLTKRKKGRKCQNEVRNVMHSIHNLDNVRRKLQVHMLTFIINFCNDITNNILLKKIKENHYKCIEYKIKKDTTKKNIKKLKLMTLADVLQLKVTSKESVDPFINQKIYKKLIETNPIFGKLYQEKLTDILQNYYINNCRYINILDRNIKLSHKTQLFNDLEQSNPSLIKKLRKATRIYFEPRKIFKTQSYFS